MPEWGMELEPAQGPWDLGRVFLTNDADADSTAFLGPVAGMGGHTAVGPLILRPYLRQEQHRARVQGQGRALWGKGDGRLLQPVYTSHTPVFVFTSAHTCLPPQLLACFSLREPLS